MGVDAPLDVVIAGRELAAHGLAATSTVGELVALGGARRLATYTVDGRAVAAAATLADAGVRRGSVVAAAGELRRAAAGIAPDYRALGPALVTGPGATPWTRTVSRPPRRPPDEPPPAITPPTIDAAPSAAGGVTVVPALVSAAGAVVAAVVLRQPLWLLMAGLGLVAALVTRGQHRWRHRRAVRRHRCAVDAAEAALTAEVAEAHDEATVRARALPDLTTAIGVARDGGVALWARRATDDDAFVVALGRGDRPWSPELTAPIADALLAAAVGGRTSLVDVPMPLALGPGTVLGIVGPRAAGRAIARSIVGQLAVHHGPADMRVVAVADGRVAAWGWVHWLPHARAPDDGRALVAAGDADADQLLDGLALATAAAPLALLLVDGADVARARTSRVRAALAGRDKPTAGIVLAERAEQLPACCTHVLAVGPHGRATLTLVRGGAAAAVSLRVEGLDRTTATAVARALARFEDPDAPSDANVPATVSLVQLLGPGAFDPQAIAAAWQGEAARADRPARAAVACAADGVVELDLERDGPHALVAGTTGSGKSELLRTWVTALAARCPPTEVTFVLVDYKGGAAFDACARLPHVVGLVTDLDDALAERALVSLEAEVRRRETLLRAVGASDLGAYRRAGHHEVVPRLVVMVDEFAALAAELPGFLDALVDVARRGRSLGVHLVLATQRPGGAVSDDVRANTNLRIALRVQDAADSHDVIGDGAAARLPRDRPGRLVIRFGPGELVTAQAASGAVTGGADVVGATPAPRAVELRAGLRRAGLKAAAAAAIDGPSELDRLVAAIATAAVVAGVPAPRRPWLDPLPLRVELPGLPGGALGVVDDPAGQRQTPLVWDPARGNLALVGCAGAVASVVLDRALGSTPAACHLYIVDAAGNPTLASLEALPHVGAVVRVDERERVERLLRLLRGEVERRRASLDAECARPAMVLLVDGLHALRHALDDPRTPESLDTLDLIATDGAALGVHVVATIDRIAAVPLRVLAAFAQRWVAPGADDAVAAPTAPARRIAGRVMVGGGLEAQVALPTSPEHVERAVGALWATDQTVPAKLPCAIGVLPLTVPAAALPPSWIAADAWHVPVGVGDHDLAPAVVVLRGGDGMLVAGPARSGRTSALRLLAAAHQALHPGAPRPLLVVPPGARRPVGPWEVADDPEGVAANARPQTLVLIDDAERVDDDVGALAALLRRRDVCVVAAGLGDALRVQYGHWTQPLRRRREGILLRPYGDADGDLLGVTLPRRSATLALPAGRGYLVADGDVRLVQLALAP